MANPTTYFGWVMPNSADLVTDLPADFNVFGQGVDTSMSQLLGGTTGQVLSKTSGTNMAFTWVTPTDETPLTTKGDLFTFTTVDARLAVGNNGETLVADSSTSTGLRYQAPKTQNALYNSGFDIAQRGTSFTALAAADYTLDRWVFWSTTASQSNSASQQSVGNLSVTPNQAIRYCGRFGRTAATTNTGARQLFQTLETSDSVRLAGQTVTFSFYARAGANYSQLLSQLNFGVVTGTGTDQIYYSFTGSATAFSGVATLTTSFQRFTATGTLPTNTTEIGTYFSFSPTGTAGAADYFEVTGLQLEVGSVATPFNRQNGTIQGELAACQRYYQKSYSQGVTVPTNATAAGMVAVASGNLANSDLLCKVTLPVVMRTAPTVVIYSYTTSQTGRLSGGNGTDLAASSGGTDWIGDSGFKVINTSGGTVNQASNGFAFHYAVSAEL